MNLEKNRSLNKIIFNPLNKKLFYKYIFTKVA